MNFWQQVSKARSRRWHSMKRKLPIIVCAALACYGLYYLDSVKHRFDEEKAAPILVNKNLQGRLAEQFKKNGGQDDEWQDIQNFVAVQYTTQAEFSNNLAARISRAAEVKDSVARAHFTRCMANAFAASQEDSDRKSVPAINDGEQCAKDYLKSTADAYNEAQERIARVYRYIKPIDLKSIRASLTAEQIKDKKPPDEPPPNSKGYVESALQPTLDDQSGLHIIYQTLRVSLLVLIVFALISFIVLLLVSVMLSDGVTTFKELATSFIGGGKSPMLPAVARGAVLSVAAIGLGTAVVGGISRNSVGDQAPVLEQSASSRSAKSPNAKPGNGSPGGAHTGYYDYSHTQYAYNEIQNSDKSFTIDSSSETGTGAIPPVVEVHPQINVPKGHGAVLDPALATSIKMFFDSQSLVNQQLAAKVTNLPSQTPKDDIKVANHVLDTGDKPLLIRLDDKEPISKLSFDVQSKLDPIKNVTNAVDNLRGSNLQEPLHPNERSRLTRWLLGPNKYFVSKRALDQLDYIKEGSVGLNNIEKQKLDDDAKKNPTLKADTEKRIAELQWKSNADTMILEAVKALYLEGGRPLDEAKLYEKLESELKVLLSTSTLSLQDRARTLERLKYWRDTILTYTRVN